jgi:aryl-alcohol dehydrogenase-like predicted oxidoreductase
MQYGNITGVDKPISRLVLGSVAIVTAERAAEMYEPFMAAGGNCFDSAHQYDKGQSEKTFGQWVNKSGLREQVVLIAKGAHTPDCYPEALSEQLLTSLDRLQTGYADLYFMHRDNPEVPVGEFVEVLNRHHRAGHIRAFGGSNWTIERIEAANAYARAKGLVGFAAVSNNFSLARSIEVPWAGCVVASTPEFRSWFERTQTPLFSWSSQAQGFFARAKPDDLSDSELVRCWYSEDNFARLLRASVLAEERGVSATGVALAYVLAQPFPTFALIGPRNPSELEDSLRALAVALSPAEVRGLNLEA